MAILATTALYMLLLVWAAWAWVRRRDPLLRDVVLIFASVGMLFVLGLVRLVVGEPPRVVAALFGALLLGQPFFSLRLVSRLRPVPRWLLVGMFAAWLASSVPVVALPRPLPAWAVWPVVGLFFAAEAVVAWLLASAARRRGGAARSRLWCAAAGSMLFGVALVIAGGGPAVAVAARAVAVVSALMYVLAFLPPRWLRRAWARDAAYTVMRRLLAAPLDEAPRDMWRRYCRDARDMLGADEVVVILPDTPATVQPVASSGPALTDRRYGEADLDDLLATDVTIDARAGQSGPVRIAFDLAEAAQARFLTAAALHVGGRRGALVLLDGHRTLFAADDVAAFTELAGQVSILAERAAVLAERQRMAVIVESSHDAIIGKTLDGVITSWNTGAQQLYGYTAAEAIGRHVSMLCPPGSQDVEMQLLDRIARGERIQQHQVQRLRKDGTTFPASLTLSPITDPTGRIVGMASICRDISERQRAEAMFRGLLEAAPDAIIGVTRDGRIALMNAQAEHLFGYRRDELLGRSVDLLVPQRGRADHADHREHYFSHPKTRPMGAGQALAAVRKDGSEFPAEISLSALETDEGLIVSAAVRDVTERLQVQAERERLAAQAERDAAERRLQHARRLESLGQLAGGVAHDFNNILGVISSYAELLLDTLDTPAPTPQDLAAARADLGQISRAADRAAQLTRQLLAFGRRDITQAQVLSLNHLIGDVEQMLRRTLGEHIHLITQLELTLSPVHADPSQLEQILLNLAVNARDAMPTGGTLSIDTGNVHLEPDDVTETTLNPGPYVRLRVSDTGTGMPAEVLERAFEPFYTTKPHGAGTGLGLATVYGIATAAGGDVHLYSEPGIGTTVTILLPATTADTDADTDATPAAHLPEGPQPHETILLAEDEHALREVATRILTRAGYHVLPAGDGAHAIRIAQTHPAPIHLLLTDVIMPKMTGNQLAERIHTIDPDIPVLYMSGYASPILTEHGTLPPGVTIIQKPFTSRELLDRIRAVLHSPAPA